MTTYCYVTSAILVAALFYQSWFWRREIRDILRAQDILRDLVE